MQQLHTHHTWAEVIAEPQLLWQHVIRAVRESSLPSVFWECAPWRPGHSQKRVRFVILDAPSLLGARPNPGPFAEHFTAAAPDTAAVAFQSLGKDAWLVAPTPPTAAETLEHGAHLAALVHGASSSADSERRLAAVGDLLGPTLAAAMNEQEHGNGGPLWLSTSGLGVSWLHVRIDTRPKYYTHAPYRSAAGETPP